jgi:predicted DNA-binding protein YlxM (UPF0122 family)
VKGAELKMLDKKQIEAIEMLVTGDYTKQEVMGRLGMHRTTFYKWIKNPEFVAALDKRLQEVKTQAQKDFTSRLPKAVEEYWKICTTCTDVRTKEKALANWIERSLGRIANTVNINDDRQDEDVDVLAAFDSVSGKNKKENKEE